MQQAARQLKQFKMVLVLLAMFAVFSAIAPKFFTGTNISNMLLQTAAYGITAVGMTFLVIVGEIDIGVGSVMALGSVVAVLTINATGSIALGFGAAVLVGAGVGLVNGLIVTRLHIDSFITTLATMSFFRGVAYLLTRGEVNCDRGEWRVITLGTPLGLPNLVVIFFLAVIAGEIVLKKTTFGRNVCATGGNSEVARYTGLRVNFYVVTTFVATNILAALSGVLIASRLNASSPSYGSDAALQIISGIVLGGTSMSGGSGGIAKSFVGLMILALVTNALNMMNVYSHYQTLIKGLLLVCIIAGDRFYTNMR